MSFVKDNLVLVLIIAAALFLGQQLLNYINDNKRLHEDLVGTTEKYEQLGEYAAKLEIQYRDQKVLEEKLKLEWANELANLKGRIKVLSNATFIIREKARESNNSDVVYIGEKMKFVLNEIRYNNGPAVGYVLIFDDGRVVSKIYNHVIDVKTAVLRDEANGVYNIATKADFVLKSPSLTTDTAWFNKPYPLKIVGGTAVVDPTEPIVQATKKFFIWAPTLNGNINLYTDTINPGIGASFMGYGYSVRDLDFKFLQVGVEYGDSVGFNFMPVLYRPLPGILKNTYIGPGITFNSSELKYFLGVNIGF